MNLGEHGQILHRFELMNKQERTNEMPERIYANDANHWHPFPGEVGRLSTSVPELAQYLKEKRNG